MITGRQQRHRRILSSAAVGSLLFVSNKLHRTAQCASTKTRRRLCKIKRRLHLSLSLSLSVYNSKRFSPFYENRKTGWGRDGACNFGQTRSHPETVGDMSRVTLNFDLSKIPFGVFSLQGQDLHSHQKLNLYIYWFSSESGYRRRRRRRRGQRQRRTPHYNH